MALRAAVFASLPLSLLGAETAPGCGCQVSHCCEAFAAFNNTSPLGYLFNGSGPFYTSTTAGMHGDEESGGYSPACSFLNLVPGIFVQGGATPGACSDVARGMNSTTVCEAIAASAEARERLHAGRSVLSSFLEPGTCGELQDGGCWESREGRATYMWKAGGRDAGDTWRHDNWCAAQGLSPWRAARVLWTVTCGSGEGEVSVRAKWVDGNGTDNSSNDGDCDSRNYSGGLDATVAADEWMGGSHGSPRWRCFDVPGGDYRLLTYIVGDTPCAPRSSTTPPESSGSAGLDALAQAAVVAVAVWAVM